MKLLGASLEISFSYRRLRCAVLGHQWGPWEYMEYGSWQRVCKRYYKYRKGCYTFQYGGDGQRVNYKGLRIQQP